MDAARLAARQERADHAAGMRRREDAADRRSGSSNAALAVRKVLCRRSTTPRLDGPTRRVPESFRSCLIRASRAVPSGPGLGKAVGERRHHRHADPRAFLDRLHRGVGRRDDIGVLGDFRQSGQRCPGALAQHLVAARVDRIDAAGISGLPQIFERAAGGLGRVVRLADDRDRVRASSTWARRRRTLSLPLPACGERSASERSEEAE